MGFEAVFVQECKDKIMVYNPQQKINIIQNKENNRGLFGIWKQAAHFRCCPISCVLCHSHLLSVLCKTSLVFCRSSPVYEANLSKSLLSRPRVSMEPVKKEKVWGNRVKTSYQHLIWSPQATLSVSYHI